MLDATPKRIPLQQRASGLHKRLGEIARLKQRSRGRTVLQEMEDLLPDGMPMLICTGVMQAKEFVEQSEDLREVIDRAGKASLLTATRPRQELHEKLVRIWADLGYDQSRLIEIAREENDDDLTDSVRTYREMQENFDSQLADMDGLVVKLKATAADARTMVSSLAAATEPDPPRRLQTIRRDGSGSLLGAQTTD
jgi:hypothetical protein